MMAKIVANVALGISVIICCWLGAETFVLPVKKDVSVGALKEECLKIDAEILRLSFRTKSVMNKIDEATLNNSIEILEYSDSTIVHAKRSQLDAYLDQLNQFKERLEAFERDLQDHLKFMEMVSEHGIKKVFDDKIVHSPISVPVV